MTRHTLNWMTLFAAVALALPGIASAHHAMMKDGMMVDHAGMTLYTFDKDSDGKSMCNGECAKNWPPLMVKAGDTAEEGWTQIKRDDGSMQWAYKGKPVYTFIKDKKAGDMTGDGMKDVWHVIK
ncbi:COG4315 family predicted lipoprotein [Pseudomonas sp. NUPR-001]|uniref:COG4315 family predicted lipoprotein n=1 Tax=Pseudomonas sp. NUPR-001 TaxID=3416058 RepID=UPI003AA01540